LDSVALAASSSRARAVAEILIKVCIVLLHTGGCAGITVRNRAIDHIKPTLPFIQPQFEVSCTAAAEISGTPLDIENAIWSTARYRSEDAGPRAIGQQVIPIRVNGVVVCCKRQAGVGKGRVARYELCISV
jgi:hypothetical protein